MRRIAMVFAVVLVLAVVSVAPRVDTHVVEEPEPEPAHMEAPPWESWPKDPLPEGYVRFWDPEAAVFREMPEADYHARREALAAQREAEYLASLRQPIGTLRLPEFEVDDCGNPVAEWRPPWWTLGRVRWTPLGRCE